MNACYSINRKAKYVTVYNLRARYPLDVWNELRAQHDMTHQEQANEMVKLYGEKK